MSSPDQTDQEYRLLFEKWGAAKVREMARSGNYDAEMRRPLLTWLAEKDAKRSRGRQIVLIAGLILFFVALFVFLLKAAQTGGVHHV
jgi:hypothetical protein